ncbi:hypothetical protein [uncultured Arcobacter sp.]|uniref:hypothetical protein n=1 Tax=uncultured Arcobacter sp. TaxID=165434 RepID=UPI002637CE48|nr:hypothetical protein [uncultured Arcobacter sp.]
MGIFLNIEFIVISLFINIVVMEFVKVAINPIANKIMHRGVRRTTLRCIVFFLGFGTAYINKSYNIYEMVHSPIIDGMVISILAIIIYDIGVGYFIDMLKTKIKGFIK